VTHGEKTRGLLTVAEVAAELRLTRESVYRRIQAGEIAAVRLGVHGPLRVPADALEQHLRPALEPRRTSVAVAANDAATARTRAGTREAA
jgi:excisionase family DNA binding protein